MAKVAHRRRLFRGPESLFIALLLLVSLRAFTQDEEAYIVSLRTGIGTPPINGFLYEVTDSMVVVLPGKLSKKGLKAALERPTLLPVPTSLISKMKIMRLRSGGRVALTSTLIAAGYTIAYVLVFPIQTLGGYFAYLASMTTFTILVFDLIHFRKYKPTEPGFAFNMQRYCLRKSELFLDR